MQTIWFCRSKSTLRGQRAGSWGCGRQQHRGRRTLGSKPRGRPGRRWDKISGRPAPGEQQPRWARRRPQPERKPAQPPGAALTGRARPSAAQWNPTAGQTFGTSRSRPIESRGLKHPVAIRWRGPRDNPSHVPPSDGRAAREPWRRRRESRCARPTRFSGEVAASGRRWCLPGNRYASPAPCPGGDADREPEGHLGVRRLASPVRCSGGNAIRGDGVL